MAEQAANNLNTLFRRVGRDSKVKTLVPILPSIHPSLGAFICVPHSRSYSC